MSKNRNRVAGVSGLVVLAFLAISIGQASAAVIWDGISPLPNDSTSWAGLGADQTLLGKTFSATSTAGNSISGSFAGNHGLVAVVALAGRPVRALTLETGWFGHLTTRSALMPVAGR
jgi:hypothetical protein